MPLNLQSLNDVNKIARQIKNLQQTILQKAVPIACDIEEQIRSQLPYFKNQTTQFFAALTANASEIDDFYKNFILESTSLTDTCKMRISISVIVKIPFFINSKLFYGESCLPCISVVRHFEDIVDALMTNYFLLSDGSYLRQEGRMHTCCKVCAYRPSDLMIETVRREDCICTLDDLFNELKPFKPAKPEN